MEHTHHNAVAWYEIAVFDADADMALIVQAMQAVPLEAALHAPG